MLTHVSQKKCGAEERRDGKKLLNEVKPHSTRMLFDFYLLAGDKFFSVVTLYNSHIDHVVCDFILFIFASRLCFVMPCMKSCGNLCKVDETERGK